MSRVFISYRRDDSADVTGRIFDRLRAHFDRKVLFRDVDAIPLGKDFREVIRKAVEDCEVLIAVIGASWLDARNEDGDRRLDDPNDFVRLEIETALRRGIAVIPVLVGRAKMPKPAQLPAPLESLVFQAGLEVRRDPDFHADVDRLIQGLTTLLTAPAVPPPVPHEPGEWVEMPLPAGEKLALAWCPPGTFRMGSTKGHELATAGTKPFFRDELPIHKVRLTRGFFLGIDPVTQLQWKVVMGTDPSYCKGPNRPVEQVSAGDAEEFCERLAKLTGKPIRLPTEAEWEYAARAGSRTEFHFGNTIDSDLVNYDCSYTWNGSPRGTPRQGTTPVGRFPANAWGLRDMHGNVWEWCQDGFDGEFYEHSPETDPLCEHDRDNSRVLRGGSWNSFPVQCRSATRYWSTPTDRHYHYGLRVCFTPA